MTKEKEREKGRESISRLRTQPASLIHPPRYFFFLPFSPSTANDFSLFCLAFRITPPKLLSFSLWQVRDVVAWTLSRKTIRFHSNEIWGTPFGRKCFLGCLISYRMTFLRFYFLPLSNELEIISYTYTDFEFVALRMKNQE